MALHFSTRPANDNHQLPPPEAARTAPAHGAVMTTRAAPVLAVTRIATGFVFLWAFLDKTFGWHYATPGAKAWIDGGSPTRGFLSNVEVGPFQSMFRDWAGATWADWAFMIGLAGVGIAVIAGVALRIAATSGTIMMLMMWAAEWPLAQHTSGGAPSMSTNPLIDYHIIFALVLIISALTYAGNTWGLGRIWNALPLVERYPWLR
ncbi:DoxX family membrane protein [Kineosporia sp. NBRC 101731]|uniref:DoxX family membrane protein n=1 Tax=Kineosporia sp. NBRC 101731 TaxID=3032199 RepID=UPI0024A09716|nr:DoxX family membrane protein [Kineosporia sp. NBRC 101731]GLY30929.1 membrane protein [Kineosporia sp. NBRC 101731]